LPRFVFSCAEHEDYGIKGWRPDWFPGADPVVGMGVAHDCLEHRASKTGPLNEEMMALGAMMFIRGGGGYFSWKAETANQWWQNGAADFEDHVQRYLAGTHDWVTMPKGGTKPLEWGDHEIPLLFKEIEQRMKEVFEDAEDQLPDWLFDDIRKEAITRLIRRGYRWAAARYCCEYEACKLFERIEKVADQELQYATEGLSKLIVSINLQTLQARIVTEEDYVW
jgi:hypothetical protein